MKNGFIIKSVIFLFFLIFFTGVVHGVIQGSSHDFSGNGWASGEICIVCHTPHNADPYGDNITDAPLWNHDADMTTVYTLYTSPTMDVAAEQPRAISKLCLSCHDGVIALDSFGGNSGSAYIAGDSLIETVLSDDHPISIPWEHQNEVSSGGCSNCHSHHPVAFISPLPFFDGYVECATCHDVHNTVGYVHLLRLPTQNSEICFHCHGK